ncbi:MAG: flavodoxin family protein [Clostridia bacterium]|nr:flavodoxin family protein [Clostridia bacterium]
MSATIVMNKPCAPDGIVSGRGLLDRLVYMQGDADVVAPTPLPLVIFGSPHKDGETAKALASYLDGAPADVVFCYDRAVAPCDDCRYCYDHAACSKSDMEDIYAAVENAEQLIFASPVYNRSFPAPMKAMLDRFQRYWAARFVRSEKPPIQKPKTAVLITTCGSDREDGEQLADQLKPLLTILNAQLTDTIHVRGTDTSETAGTISVENVKAEDIVGELHDRGRSGQRCVSDRV